MSATAQRFFVPISGIEQVERIEFSLSEDDEHRLTLRNVCLANYEENYTVNQLATGVFQTNPIERHTLRNSDKIIPDGSQVLVNEDVIYALSYDQGSLIAYRAGGGTYEELSRVEHLGNVRDMAFTEDKRAIIVTARQQGMYIIDVSDPASMSLVARRETQELTTGVCVAGNYAFLADRRMGIEIWDVSDIYAPRYVNGVLSEDTSTSQREYQDCVVDGHFLYVGVYDGKGVAIYDIATCRRRFLRPR